MRTTSEPISYVPDSSIPIHRFTVGEYHRLAEVGILGDHDRVELLDGLISNKSIHSPIHDARFRLSSASSEHF